MQCYPNPSADKVTVSFNVIKKSIMSVQIYNLQGKIVVTDKINATPGRNEYLIDQLKQGVYLVQLSDGVKSVTRKIVITN